MRRLSAVLATASLVAAGGVAAAVLTSQPALAQTGGFDFNQPQDYVTGLAAPWDMVVLPGGSMLVTLRDNAQNVRPNPPGTGAPPLPPVSIPNVSTAGEGGLLGLALHPNYNQNGWVYAYHTSPSDNRIVRFQLNNSNTPQNLQTVLTGIPRGTQIHNGGRIAFGSDGLLYVATGDAGQPSTGQNLQSLAGKILRMTDTGGVPPGNPFGNSLVFSYGHRNVQGLGFDSQGRLWASEFGAAAWDEINLIQAGGNYSWPNCEGFCNPPNPNFIDPVHAWTPAEASPSGAAIANDTLFVAALRGQRLWVVPLMGSGIGTPVAVLQGQYGRLRAVAVGPDGGLYVMTNNTDGRGTPRQGDDRIVRFPPSGGQQPPPPPPPGPPPPQPPGSTGPVVGVGSGKCLDVPGFSQANDTQLQIWDCHGGTNQQWTYTSTQQLMVYGTKCLDAAGSGSSNGTRVILWDCHGGANQQWNINSNGSITSAQSGLCLDVAGVSTANPALVQLRSCHGATNQHRNLG
jgi:glucose/arabinose dehydrogenase